MLPYYLAESKRLTTQFTAQLIQLKVRRKRLVTENVHEGCYICYKN